MKFLSSFIILLIASSVTVLAQKSEKVSMYSGHVENFQMENADAGTITVNATGFDKSLSDSKLHAIRSAFYVLMFRGVAGSKYSIPMIDDEKQASENPVIKNLLKDGYSTFTTKISELEADEKSRKIDGDKGYQTVLQITINADALRRHLEQNNVIRKFGF